MSRTAAERAAQAARRAAEDTVVQLRSQGTELLGLFRQQQQRAAEQNQVPAWTYWAFILVQSCNFMYAQTFG